MLNSRRNIKITPPKGSVLNFFSPVVKIRHIANQANDFANFADRLDAEEQKAREIEEEIQIIECPSIDYVNRETNISNIEKIRLTLDEVSCWVIFFLEDLTSHMNQELDNVDGTWTTKRKCQRNAARPKNWRVCVQEFNSGTSFKEVLKTFPDCFLLYDGQRCSDEASRMRLRRWQKDYSMERTTGISWESRNNTIKPVITKELDDKLYANVMTRIQNGLALDEYMFREE